MTIHWNGAATVLRMTTMHGADLANSNPTKMVESRNLAGRASAPSHKPFIAGVALIHHHRPRDSLVRRTRGQTP